jgi:hypothetical protein
MHRDNSQVSTPWLDSLLEEQQERMVWDMYPYGLEQTRHEIERAFRYLHEQALIDRPLAVDEIFVAD